MPSPLLPPPPSVLCARPSCSDVVALARRRVFVHLQLRHGIAGRVRKARIRQLCRERDYESRQYNERAVQRQAQHGAHLNQG